MALLKNKRFINPYKKKIYRSIFHYLFWQMGFYKEKVPVLPLPNDFVYPCDNRNTDLSSLYKVTWVNHSTFLIEANGITFLTDPIFTKRCSPFPFLGPKRKHAATPSIENLPKIDFVLLSHNHYDHLDRNSIRKLQRMNPNIQWIVPLGVKSWFLKKVFEVQPDSIYQFDWYESHEFICHEKKIRCTSVPAQHFSGRGLFDKNRSLWMGIVVEIETKRFYFAGDTGYNEVDFKKIGELYQPIDLSLLPIGVYTPRRFMQGVHIHPQEAVMIHKEVGSSLSVGGHWKTFKLSHEELQRPPFDLYCALQRQHCSPNEFRVLEPGQMITW